MLHDAYVILGKVIKMALLKLIQLQHFKSIFEANDVKFSFLHNKQLAQAYKVKGPVQLHCISVCMALFHC